MSTNIPRTYKYIYFSICIFTFILPCNGFLSIKSYVPYQIKRCNQHNKKQSHIAKVKNDQIHSVRRY